MNHLTQQKKTSFLSRLTLFSLFLTVFSLASFAQLSRIETSPLIKNYDTEDYKGGIQNWDITQAQDGRLYVANNLGLLQYDGGKWQNFQIQYGTKLRSLLVSEDRIYVGSQNDFGYFEPNAIGELNYTSLADSLPDNLRGFDETWKIYQDNETLYFCTFNHIFKLHSGQLKAIPSSYPLEISFFVDHRLLVQEWGKGLSHVQEDRLTLIRGGSFFKDKRISSILNYNKEVLLISTFNDGLFLYDKGEITRFEFPDLPNGLIVNDAILISDGRMALGTQISGLFILDLNNNTLQQIDKSVGLMDNTVNGIYEDLAGSLWLSLNNGICRIDLSSPLSIIDERSGVQGAGYAALKVKDKTYLGTNIGAYVVQNNRVTKIAGSEGQVYNIQEFNGKVYIGHHEGLMRIENNKVTLLTEEKGAWKLIQTPQRNDLAILGTYNGIKLFDLNTDKVVNSFEGFNESSRVMAFENEDLWITQGYKGAYRLKLNLQNGTIASSQLYNAKDGFPSDFLINVFEVDGELIFTAERGFYRYNQESDSFVADEDFNRLLGSDAAIVDIDEDAMGNIYFIERNKVGRLSKTTIGHFELTTNYFGTTKKLWNDDLGNIRVIDHKYVLLGAREGFILYDKEKDKGITNDLNIAFDEISVLNKGDSAIYHGHGPLNVQDVSLPYSNNSLGFTFYSPDFQSEENTEFQYRLENYQNQWSNWSATSYKEFSNLKEGSYAFQVRAKNMFDQESETITYRFSIEPPIYRSTLAYFVYASGTLFLLFLGFKTVDHRHQAATRALEEKKNSELEEKNKRIETIAQESEREIDELKSKKLEAELRLKSQDLTSSAMHLIQKNELLTKVKKTLKGLDKENLEEAANAELRRLVKQIDKDLASSEEWSQFEQNFDQVHGNFITRLKEAYPKLTPQEIKFSAYIRMNLNTKEIANLLNISVRGVEIGRYRVRKKLELERKDNLSDFLMRF